VVGGGWTLDGSMVNESNNAMQAASHRKSAPCRYDGDFAACTVRGKAPGVRSVPCAQGN
jgi:hypothetical protein